MSTPHDDSPNPHVPAPPVEEVATNPPVAPETSPQVAPETSPRVATVTKKRSWYVSEEATQRLGIEATMDGVSESEIVDRLLKGLRKYSKPRLLDASEHRQDGVAA